ncbi:MAG TPA: hypothetical protein VI386_17875 [Candidatus Sulfotelmatobacter sp.]
MDQSLLGIRTAVTQKRPDITRDSGGQDEALQHQSVAFSRAETARNHTVPLGGKNERALGGEKLFGFFAYLFLKFVLAKHWGGIKRHSFASFPLSALRAHAFLPEIL